MKNEVILWSSVGALIIGVLSLVLQRRSVAVQTGDATPFTAGSSTTLGAPTFNFGSRSINIGAGGMPLNGITSGCGCGGSYGDYAVARLAPIFGDTQQILPYAAKPKTPQPLGVELISNGAGV